MRVKKPKLSRVNFHISPENLLALSNLSNAMGMNLSETIRRACLDYILKVGPDVIARKKATMEVIPG